MSYDNQTTRRQALRQALECQDSALFDLLAGEITIDDLECATLDTASGLSVFEFALSELQRLLVATLKFEAFKGITSLKELITRETKKNKTKKLWEFICEYTLPKSDDDTEIEMTALHPELKITASQHLEKIVNLLYIIRALAKKHYDFLIQDADTKALFERVSNIDELINRRHHKDAPLKQEVPLMPVKDRFALYIKSVKLILAVNLSQLTPMRLSKDLPLTMQVTYKQLHHAEEIQDIKLLNLLIQPLFALPEIECANQFKHVCMRLLISQDQASEKQVKIQDAVTILHRLQSAGF